MKLLASFFLFLFCVTLSTAQQPVAEIVKYFQKKEVQDFGITTYFEIEIRINNREGDVYADIGIPFSTNKVNALEAGIYTSSGEEIRKLKKKDIKTVSDISDISLYEDSYNLEFSLRHNQYPYIIKYSYNTFLNTYVHIAHWYPAFYKNIPTLKSELIIEAPLSRNLFIQNSDGISYSKEENDTRQLHKFSGNYLKKITNETWSPPIQELYPQVYITSDLFWFGVEGNLASWQNFGNWINKLNSGMSDLPNSERFIIKEKLKGIENELDQIKTIYTYLQESTRYINISIDEGGLKTYPASYVVKNRYGDCKALTNYMKSALEVVGINSFYTLVNAGNAIEKIPVDFPGQHFNHVILAVPVKTDTLWLDCTSDYAFNYLGTFTQNRYALLTNGMDSKILKTPALAKEDVLVDRAIEYRTIQDKTVLTESISAKGNMYETLSSISNNYNPKQVKEIIEDHFLFNSFSLDSFKVTTTESDSILLKLYQSSESFNKRFGNEIMWEINPLTLPNLETPIKRKYPVRINYPQYLKEHHTFLIPAQKKATFIPENQKITSKFGEYTIEFESHSDKIIVRRMFFLKEGEYALEEYPEFYTFMMDVINRDNQNKILIK